VVFEKERKGECKGVVALSYPFILNQNCFYILFSITRKPNAFYFV
jgi:hypothetical protein